MNDPIQTADIPHAIIGTPKLDKWLRDNKKTGLDIPGQCWGMANRECEKNEIYKALHDLRKNLESKNQQYSGEYRRMRDSILDIWTPIFEKIALDKLTCKCCSGKGRPGRGSCPECGIYASEAIS